MPIKPLLVCCIACVPLIFGGCIRNKADQTSHADSVKNSSGIQSERGKDTLQVNPTATPGNRGEKYTECYGTIVIPASDFIIVAPPAGGILKSILYPAGSYVQSGSTLATLENIDFLKLQQDYLETKSRFSYCREELKRQGELTIENASSVKKMQQAQLDYQICEIKLHSLAKQLTLTGFIADSVEVDHLSPVISLHAPVSGYIEKIVVRAGNSVAPGETMFIMSRNYHPVIAIEIHEKNFKNIKIGEPLSFYLSDDTLVSHKARISFIGNQINPEKHMMKVNAKPLDQTLHLIPGMQVRIRFNTTE